MSTGEEEEEEEEEPGDLVDQEEEVGMFLRLASEGGFPRMNMRGRRLSDSNGRGAEAFLGRPEF